MNKEENKSECKEIQIETLLDIVDKVPEESLDNFLTDLKIFVLEAKKSKERFLKIMPKEVYESCIKEEMIWIDDGETGVKWTRVVFEI